MQQALAADIRGQDETSRADLMFQSGLHFHTAALVSKEHQPVMPFIILQVIGYFGAQQPAAWQAGHTPANGRVIEQKRRGAPQRAGRRCGIMPILENMVPGGGFEPPTRGFSREETKQPNLSGNGLLYYISDT
jgi:hypothetical protein